ncbi:hypothetical protein [Bradyrhizobium pachyrhizi]|uniref:hypothetical protein n=1 Tax=Bradyrhizobium pachyrhizi TaxID=280333 RepID=UPI000AA0BFD1|nr:hypothetical protein [Bradyrhizobium pachyrhizi]
MPLRRGASHLVTCRRLLDPEAADADWKEVDRNVLHIDPDLGQCALANRSSSIWRPQNAWLTGISAAFFRAARPNSKLSHVESEIENNVLANRPNRAAIIEATGASAKPHTSISTWATSEQGLAGRKSAHRAPSDYGRGQIDTGAVRNERNRDKRRNEAPDIRWPPPIDVSAGKHFVGCGNQSGTKMP